MNKILAVLLLPVGLAVSGCEAADAAICTDNDSGLKVECRLTPGKTSSDPPEVEIVLDKCFVGYDRNITVEVPEKLLPASKVERLTKSCGCLASDVESKDGKTLLHVYYSPKGGSEKDSEQIVALGKDAKHLLALNVSATSIPEVVFNPPALQASLAKGDGPSFRRNVEIGLNRKESRITTLRSFPIGTLIQPASASGKGFVGLEIRLDPHYVGQIKGNIRLITEMGREVLYPIDVSVPGNMTATPRVFVLDPKVHKYQVIVRSSKPVDVRKLVGTASSERPPSAGEKPGALGEPTVKIEPIDKNRFKVTLVPNLKFRGLAVGSAYIKNRGGGEVLAIPYELFVG